MAGRRTTTTYALLGVLSLQPFSAYDLAKYMRRSALAQIWPRTEAAIYRETRRLADAGLASGTVEATGNRERTVYTITDEGQSVLDAWLGEPAAPMSFEAEAAVKALFLRGSHVSTLRSQLEQVALHEEQTLLGLREAINPWLEGDLAFPERAHYSALTGDLIVHLHEATLEWARRWSEHISDWDDLDLDEAKYSTAHQVLAALAIAPEAE